MAWQELCQFREKSFDVVTSGLSHYYQFVTQTDRLEF